MVRIPTTPPGGLAGGTSSGTPDRTVSPDPATGGRTAPSDLAGRIPPVQPEPAPSGRPAETPPERPASPAEAEPGQDRTGTPTPEPVRPREPSGDTPPPAGTAGDRPEAPSASDRPAGPGGTAPEAPESPPAAPEATPAATPEARRTRIEPVGRAARRAAAGAKPDRPAAARSRSAAARSAAESASAAETAARTAAAATAGATRAASATGTATVADAEVQARRLTLASDFVKGPFEFVRPLPEGGGGGGDAVALSDYLAVLRREIARAGLEGTSDDTLPMVGIAEAEITLGCVAVGLREDRLLIDPSWKALAEAPKAAVQQLRVRLVDADLTLALRPKD